MRTSFAILAAGAVLIVPAAPAFAVSGSAAGVDASASQYKSSTDHHHHDDDSEASVPLAEEIAPAVVQEAPQLQPPPPPPPPPPEDVALPLGEETPTEQALPAAREVAKTVTVLQRADELPFTGYLALLVIGAGLLSLTAGMLLRRATRSRGAGG